MSECAHTTRVSTELAAGLKVKVFRFPDVHVKVMSVRNADARVMHAVSVLSDKFFGLMVVVGTC